MRPYAHIEFQNIRAIFSKAPWLSLEFQSEFDKWSLLYYVASRPTLLGRYKFRDEQLKAVGETKRNVFH